MTEITTASAACAAIRSSQADSSLIGRASPHAWHDAISAAYDAPERGLALSALAGVVWDLLT